MLYSLDIDDYYDMISYAAQNNDYFVSRPSFIVFRHPINGSESKLYITPAYMVDNFFILLNQERLHNRGEMRIASEWPPFVRKLDLEAGFEFEPLRNADFVNQNDVELHSFEIVLFEFQDMAEVVSESSGGKIYFVEFNKDYLMQGGYELYSSLDCTHSAMLAEGIYGSTERTGVNYAIGKPCPPVWSMAHFSYIYIDVYWRRLREVRGRLPDFEYREFPINFETATTYNNISSSQKEFVGYLIGNLKTLK